MKIRMHRTMLEDAMKTVAEIDGTRESIKDYIALALHYPDALSVSPTIKPEDIEVKPYMYDSRIDWDTHIVTWKGQAVAFTDGPEIKL